MSDQDQSPVPPQNGPALTPGDSKTSPVPAPPSNHQPASKKSKRKKPQVKKLPESKKDTPPLQKNPLGKWLQPFVIGILWFGIFLICTTIGTLIVGIIMETAFSSHWGWFFGFCLGIAAWLVLVAFTIGYCFRYVRALTIVVFMNWKGEIRFLRKGLNPVIPFYETVQKKPGGSMEEWVLDLEQETIPIGKGPDGESIVIRIFVTKDKLPISVQYRGVICPNIASDDTLWKYISYDNGVIAEQFEAIIDQELSDRIAKLTQAEVLQNKKTIMDDISAIFSKGEEDHPLEEHFGAILNSLAIDKIELDPDVLKALKLRMEMASVADGVQKMKNKGLLPDDAADVVLIVRGDKTATSTTFVYEGLDKLPKYIKYFGIGAPGMGVMAGDVGGKSGGGKKGGK